MIVALALAAAGCGKATSDDPTISARGATCTVGGTSLSISADNLRYDKGCLAAPAGQAFTITFDNKESLPHDVVILGNQDSTPLFSGQIVSGPTEVTYSVKGLPAGTYRFHCSVHPTQMQGSLVVA
ncbi:MAG: cupredoxin domain-containing protein [Acidimicrobiales bacterium]